MARVLCIANQKGGVGKTTTAVNVSSGMARAGFETLLIDLDPQCNATSNLRIEIPERHPLVADAPLQSMISAADFKVAGEQDPGVATDGLVGNQRITNQSDGDQTESLPRLKVVPGCRRLEDLSRLNEMRTSEVERVAQRVAEVSDNYDFVLIDCPPSLGQLTETALSISNEVVMPLQCEYFAMEGLTQMIQVIRRVMGRQSNQLQFGGILLTMYDEQLELTQEVEEEVRSFFGDVVFQTVIPRDVAIAEAPSHGQSVLAYSPRARGSRAYVELCMEVLERD